MARYGTFKYSEEKYGASVNTNLLLALEIDWDNDNVFDGSNEAVRMTRFQTERGRDFYLSADGNGFETNPIGYAICTLDNYDGKYDPWNTLSELYGYLATGKKARLWLRNGIDGTDYHLITGILTDIKPYGRKDEVDLVIDCGMRWLQDRTPSVQLHEGIYADDAIELILDDISYPSIWGRAIDTAPDPIGYWWTTGKKAKSEIEDIANSGMGYFFVAADGTATYYSRHRTDTSVMTITEDEILKTVSLPQPWEFQRNIIKVNAHPLIEQAESNLWTLRETPYVDDGDSIVIWLEYTYGGTNISAVDVIDPVATTDYTMNTASDDSGSDLTSGWSVVANKFSKTAKLTLTNNSGSGGYVTLATIRGKAVTSPDVTTVIEEGTGADDYPREMELDLPWQQDYNTAVDFAGFLKGFLGSPNAFPTIIIENRPEIQFGLELYDRVTLQLDSLGIDQDFRVGKIKHKSKSDTCQLVSTEISFFPAYDTGGSLYWILGQSLLGSETYMGW